MAEIRLEERLHPQPAGVHGSAVQPAGSARARVAFAVFFWIYTAISVLWLLIGLIPGLIGALWTSNLRDLLALLPDARWVREIAVGFYAASLAAEPPLAVFFQYAFSALNIVLGIVLFRLRPADWCARLLALGMIGTAAVFNYQAHSTLDLLPGAVNTLHELLHLFAGSTYLLGLLLFPTGTLPPWPVGRWRPPEALRRLLGPLLIASLALLGYMFTSITHGEPSGFVFFYGVLVPEIGIAGQIVRYRQAAGPQERQLSKTLVLALALALIVALALGALSLLLSLPTLRPGPLMTMALQRIAFTIFPLLFAMLPISLTLIVLRYRLWEIDLVINRSLVYGALTALIVGLYGLLVGGLSVALGGRYNVAVAVLATALVAVLFQPLRERLQRAVNRLMYGERDDPLGVLARLGQRLESNLSPHATLPLIVETVAQALRLPYAAIAMQIGETSRVVAEYPARPWSMPLDSQDTAMPQAPTDSPPATRHDSPNVERLPLVYQGEAVGQLIVAARAPGERFSRADRRLLTNIAQRTGAALVAVRLAGDLQRSRERLVLAREEERRRLRRDLHDDLGPQLATLALKLDAIRNTIDGDPAAARQMLGEVKAQAQAAIGDIRRLVYDLRPPALDQLGLLGALNELAAHAAANHLDVQVQAPADLPALPAAVEVAVYRITSEALTNVVRHAQARRATVWLCPDDALYLAVDDDGMGLPHQAQPGVGLASMRERAEELGGACRIERRPEGGTRVIARLPVDRTT